MAKLHEGEVPPHALFCTNSKSDLKAPGCQHVFFLLLNPPLCRSSLALPQPKPSHPARPRPGTNTNASNTQPWASRVLQPACYTITTRSTHPAVDGRSTRLTCRVMSFLGASDPVPRSVYFFKASNLGDWSVGVEQARRTPRTAGFFPVPGMLEVMLWVTWGCCGWEVEVVTD